LIALRAGASRFRAWFAVAVAALLVAALLAVPAGTLAASTQLSDASITPAVGTTATTFTFGITYQNHEGSGAPNEVSVVIDGVKHAMIAGGSDWKAGVRFTYSTKLSAGSHTIVFHSVGRGRFVSDLSAGSVAVGPAPTPRPTPAPTPRPTSPPATTSPSTPPSGPASTPGQPATGPGAGGTTSGGSSGGASGSGSSGSGARRPSGAGRAGGPYRSARVNGPVATVPPVASGSGSDARRPADAGQSADSSYAGAGWGDLALYLKALSWGGSATRTMPLLPSIVFTVGTMVILMAFMFFGKRRRDGEPPEPDEVLSARAARGTGQAATATLVPKAPIVPGIPEDEIGMPRWRRPSLLEARKMDPARSAVAAAAPLSFSRSAVGFDEGHERRYIRYHVVGLLDIPDEFRGTQIGELARDDEVQLLERSGTYWRVLCPDGREGWIHKMTLGDVVGEPSSPTPAEAFANSRPWDEMENGVLTAFIAARGRA
jgi:hypothetical protein